MRAPTWNVWPVWHTPPDPSQLRSDGYGHIARYVSPTLALRGLTGLSSGVRRSVESNVTTSPRDVNVAIISRLYGQLLSLRVPYSRPTWNPMSGQVIKDPAWILSPGESATCIEFAVLFAAMCLREGIPPFLVMLRSRQSAHALVALGLDWSPTVDAPRINGTRNDGGPGIRRVVDGTRCSCDGRLLVVDCTLAEAGTRATLDEAVAAGKEALCSPFYPDRHLVDIAMRHRHRGEEPLRPPQSQRVLTNALPDPERERLSFPSREPLTRLLRNYRGRVAILGPPGIGKTELACDVAAAVDEGRGWFLNGTSVATLTASLAAAELAERGDLAEELDAIQRGALAQDALNRLARATGRWSVVVDNALASPTELSRWLPSPHAHNRQLLIVTSTEASWNASQGRVETLAPLTEKETLGLVLDADLQRLSGGRPLLIDAFRSAYGALGISPHDLAADLSAHRRRGPEPELAALWAVVRAQIDSASTKAAEHLAWMLPVGTPTHLLCEVANVAREAVERLAATGLVTLSKGGMTTSMHRSIAEVIRRMVKAERREVEIVIRVLCCDAAAELLTLRADRRLTEMIAAALPRRRRGAAIAPVRESQIGIGLRALATMQEVHETAAVSALTAHAALGFLDRSRDVDRPLMADCLHMMARAVNQSNAKSVPTVRRAISWARQAQELRGVDELGQRSKHRALEALLLQRYADVAYPEHFEKQLSVLEQALAMIEESWRERERDPGTGPRLVDRAQFNRAGIRVALANLRPERAKEYLDVAEDTYTQTLQFRQKEYRDPNPLTAASHNGLSIVWYYRTLLEGLPKSRGDRLLLDASHQAWEAVEQRHQTDGGRDGNDSLKSLLLLAKILLARAHRADAKQAVDSFLGEVALERSLW